MEWAERGDPEGIAILASRPILSEDAAPFHEAWKELDSDRHWTTTMGGSVPHMIPWQTLDRFAVRHGLDEDDFANLRYIIRSADAAWMKELNRTRAKDAAKKPPTGTRPPGR